MNRGRPSAPLTPTPLSPGERGRGEGSANSFVRRRLGWAVCLLALVGCGGTPGKGLVKDDPFFGPSGATPPPNAITASDPGPKSSDLRAEMNNLPNPSPPPSLAAIVSGQVQPLESAPVLAIGSGLTPLRQGDAGSARNQGTILHAPISVNDPRGSNLTGGTFAPASAPPRITSVQQGRDWLEQRGLTNYNTIKALDGSSFRFICLVPVQPNSTQQYRRYAFDAADEVTAMQAVIEKIEADSK